MAASIEQIWNIVASHPKFVFFPTFVFCSPICPNYCGLVFLWKYILVFEKWFFRSTAQICKFSPWILLELCDSCNEFTWPPVFLSTWCFVLSSKLNPLSLLKLANKNLFLVNIFVRHTFSMSNSSIETKTVLTMTDMTESTELLAFKRQNFLVCLCFSNMRWTQSPAKFTCERLWNIHLVPICRHRLLALITTICKKI